MDAQDRRMLVLAKQFREAAADAGRTDVVDKIDEAVMLLAHEQRPRDEEEKTNVVLRILDGLGL